MNSDPLLGTGGIIFVGLYLFSLIGIGMAGRMARKENTLSDFYLAGRGMGVFVLFLTLYATQYSGNTMIGFAGKAYRGGYQSLVMVIFMSSIIGAYFLFAPKLFRLSKKHGFITTGDFIHHRFKNTVLTIIIVIISIFALGNYILTNLKAIGYIVVAATGGRVGFAQGIILLSLIMVIYETLGGMRSVAWTDVIQGVLLLVGVILIFIVIQVEYGGMVTSAEIIKSQNPEFFNPPNWTEKRLWISTIGLAFFGISVYPHAIQRIYAAKDEHTLKRSLQIMVFMPLITTMFMMIVGWVGLAQFPNLDRQGSEQITILMLQDIGYRIPAMGMMIVLFLSAAIAAIMSTVDSALLAISAMVTKDLYGRLQPGKSQGELIRIGKIFSWLIMGLAVLLAIKLPQTIWRLMEIKLELLCQIAPAIFLGLHLKRLSSRAVLYGVIIGTIVAVIITLHPLLPAKPLGIHAGIWGLLINVVVLVVFQLRIHK
jgi:SSS family solute:Na+ symporter/sodium/pantothenate symporter